MSYTNLGRDKIPEIIKAKGINPINHIAGDDEFESALMDKLQEEVKEFIEDPCKEEMADIMEVIYAILKQKQYSFDDIEKVRRKKADERGAFNKRIIAHIE